MNDILMYVQLATVLMETIQIALQEGDVTPEQRKKVSDALAAATAAWNAAGENDPS